MNAKELINGISRVMDTIKIGTPSYLILKEAQEIIKESSVNNKSDEFVIESFDPVIEIHGYRDSHDWHDCTLTCEYMSDAPDGYMYKITKRQDDEDSDYEDTIIVKLARRPKYEDIEKIWRSLKDNS